MDSAGIIDDFRWMFDCLYVQYQSKVSWWFRLETWFSILYDFKNQVLRLEFWVLRIEFWGHRIFVFIFTQEEISRKIKISRSISTIVVTKINSLLWPSSFGWTNTNMFVSISVLIIWTNLVISDFNLCLYIKKTKTIMRPSELKKMDAI